MFLSLSDLERSLTHSSRAYHYLMLRNGTGQTHGYFSTDQ